MRSHKRGKKILLLSVPVLVAAVAMTTLYGQGRNGADSTRREESSRRHTSVEDYPVADYSALEPSDPQERDKRRARSGRHDIPDKALRGTKGFVLGEDSESISITQRPDHAPPEPAIPASQSDAVIVGEITDAKAYLSNDKSSVYSEFTLLPSEVLKDCASLKLTPNTPVIAERSGGRVRLPSGKILLRGFSHKGMPRVGGRYVLFLKRNDEGQDFSIVTGYQLRAGRVHPLDGVPEGDYKLPQFAAYEGADETSFLNDVRAAIAQAASGKVARQ